MTTIEDILAHSWIRQEISQQIAPKETKLNKNMTGIIMGM